jgi:hypothetical protein
MSPIPPVITPEPVVEEPDHPVDCTGNVGRELGLEHCGGGAVGFATVNFKLGDVVKIALGGVRDYFCQPHPDETGNYPCDEHTAPLAEVSPAERLIGGLDPPLVDLKSSGVGYIPELNPDLSPSGSGEDITFIGLKGAVDFKTTRVEGSLGPGIIVARHTDPVQGPLVSVGPYFELEAGAVALGDGLDIGLGAVGYLTFKDPLANLPTLTYDDPPLTPRQGRRPSRPRLPHQPAPRSRPGRRRRRPLPWPRVPQRPLSGPTHPSAQPRRPRPPRR